MRDIGWDITAGITLLGVMEEVVSCTAITPPVKTRKGGRRGGKEGRKEGRKDGRKEGRKEGKEGGREGQALKTFISRVIVAEEKK